MTASTMPVSAPLKFNNDVHSSYGGSRIPESLKQVFILSNQGNDVFEAPKDRSAFKMFERPKFVDLKQTRSVDNDKIRIPTEIRTRAPRKKLGQRRDNPANEISSCSNHSAATLVSKARKKLFRIGKPEESNPVDPDKECEEKKENEAPTTSSSTTTRDTETVKPQVSSYPSQRSPQVFLDVMLRTLGYSTELFNTLETSYSNQPTSLQVASFHARLQDLVQCQAEYKLRKIMKCGISPNPCNRHGDYVLNTACRAGWDTSVRVLLECGASVQVCDAFGRTPLHSAFFGTKPSYEIVGLLIKKDRHLLQLKDRHGATPLDYIARDQWGVWIDYLYSKRDFFWPRRNKRIDGVEGTPPKMMEKPNSAPPADPPNALFPEMATMVAAGKLSPEEAQCLMAPDDETSTNPGSSSYDDSSYAGSSFGGSSCYDDSTFGGDSSHCASSVADSTYAESLDDYESIAGDFDDADEFGEDIEDYRQLEQELAVGEKTSL